MKQRSAASPGCRASVLTRAGSLVVEKDSPFQTLCALIKKKEKKDVPFISYLVPLPSKNSSLHWERGVRLAAGYYSVRAQLKSSLTLK